MIEFGNNNYRLQKWLKIYNNKSIFYRTMINFNNVKHNEKEQAIEYILKSFSEKKRIYQNNQILLKWKIFIENSFPIENMINTNKYIIKKITIYCGPPGSGKSVDNNSFIIDFDLIANWFYQKLNTKIPPYIIADYKPFRNYINNIQTEVIKILCYKYSYIQPDITICCCNCKRIIDIIDSINIRFSILLNVKYCQLPKYDIWYEFQKNRKTTNSINYRTFNKQTYNNFKIEGDKVWKWLQKFSKERPEVCIEKIIWSDKKIKNKFIRPVYTLTRNGKLLK
jgi:hypothetical protein